MTTLKAVRGTRDLASIELALRQALARVVAGVVDGVRHARQVDEQDTEGWIVDPLLRSRWKVATLDSGDQLALAHRVSSWVRAPRLEELRAGARAPRLRAGSAP